MTSRIIPVDPFDLVVFGGTGDLAQRKLFPALYYRFRDEQMPEDSRVIGVSRRALSDADYRSMAAKALLQTVPEAERDTAAMDGFLDRLRYVQGDVANRCDWPPLGDLLTDASRIRAFYLATAPDLFHQVCAMLAESSLVTPETRVVLEKPLGNNLASAREINDTVGRTFDEGQIYRIDHFLGKETVQNLLALRFANALFEPLWNSAHVDHVQITVAESLGIEGRGAFYDRAGALRDMVQNHLLQLLCLVAMEPPASTGADAVRDEKLKVLNSLRPILAGDVARRTVRGQYRAGACNGAAVAGYLDDLGTGADSDTETFVALKTAIENWRWAGVPFYLRTGKRLAARVSDIVIQFKDIPHSIFHRGAGKIDANRMIIRLQPDEGVKLMMTIKDPGPGGMRLAQVPLNLSFADTFAHRFPDAYERLVMDVIRGNQTLFMRRDEVEAAWRWIDPILDAWEAENAPLTTYTAGSWGPSSAIALIERDGRTWHEEHG